MKHPLVVIIILNWNGWKDTIKCLRSLRDVTYDNFHIVLIDNGSTDDSISEILPHLDSRIFFFPNKENIGFAKGCNQGIEYAIDNMGADWVMLLNNDTFVDPNFLTEMMFGAARNTRVGMIQPLMLQLNNTRIIDSTGHIISWGQVYDRDNGTLVHRNYSHGLIGCSGAAGLYRVDMIKEIGMLDESYSSGYEDSEYSWRAYNAGWKTAYDPDAIVLHKRGTSITKRMTDVNFTNTLFADAARPCKTHGSPVHKLQLVIYSLYMAARSEAGYILGRNNYGATPSLKLLQEMFK